MTDERKEVECLMREKRYEDGTTLSGHAWKLVEKHEDGCGVEVLKCDCCGKYEVGWWRADTPPPKVCTPQPGDVAYVTGTDIPDACEECAEPWPRHRDYCSRGTP